MNSFTNLLARAYSTMPWVSKTAYHPDVSTRPENFNAHPGGKIRVVEEGFRNPFTGGTFTVERRLPGVTAKEISAAIQHHSQYLNRDLAIARANTEQLDAARTRGFQSAR